MRRTLITLIVSSLALVAHAHAGSNSSQRPAHAGSGTSRQPARAAKRDRWFFVAVLRSDGVIVPFSTYWRGLWLAPWRQPKGNPPEVNSVADLPAPWFTKYEGATPVWYASTPRAGAADKLNAAPRPVAVDNHCSQNWGWQTDYRDAKKEGHGHANVGIAVSEPAEIVAPARLDPSAAGVREIVALIRRRFDADERLWLTRPDVDWYAGLVPPAGVRERKPPDVVSLYRVAAAGGRAVYVFGAERRYAKPGGAADADCEGLSAFGGILLQDAGGTRFVERQFVLSDCDGVELTYGLPLGLIRDGGREFLILEEDGYEDERYTILELRGDGLLRRLRQIEGGAC